MMLDIFRLDGKVAWITGGNKGLGLAMAHALASVGADIVLTGRTPGAGAAAAKQVSDKHGRRCIGIDGDVTDAAQIRAIVDQATSELGHIDVLVTAAGINIRKNSLEMSPQEFREIVDISLTGAFIASQAALPGMLERGWGRIIHVASMLGLVGLSERPAYTAAKGAMIQLARTQALEFATRGVTVNALCPGPFPTEINRPLLADPRKYQAMAERIPMARWGEMNELDGAIIFLASPASSYMTGATLVVDGGCTAQ